MYGSMMYMISVGLESIMVTDTLEHITIDYNTDIPLLYITLT